MCFIDDHVHTNDILVKGGEQDVDRCVAQLANLPRLNQLPGALNGGGVAHLVVHERQLLWVGLGSRKHRLCLCRVERCGLVDQDVLAGLECICEQVTMMICYCSMSQ